VVIIFNIKEKSEDYLLKRLVSEVTELNKEVKELYEEQCVKASISKDMVRGIKEQGRSYRTQLAQGKERISKIIASQQDRAAKIKKHISRLEHNLTLLIQMEQASLAIHTANRQDDLSDMVDVHQMPADKFMRELEQLQMLQGSFDILKVELEKQKQYTAAFDLDENTLDEQYFMQSEKLERKLSEEEIISVSQLKDFCSDLQRMIAERLGKSMPYISESDKAAHNMIRELKQVRMHPGLFAETMYKFTEKFIATMVRDKQQKRLILFLVLFLLSRLKRFRPDAFYQQLRTTILCYDMLSSMSVDRRQRRIIAGSMLMANLQMLEILKDKDDEAHIIKNYYHTANRLFNEELRFASMLLAAFQGNGDVTLPWMESGAQAMKLVFDFDVALAERLFNIQKISVERDDIAAALHADNKGCEQQIKWLLDSWQKMISSPLRQI